MKVCYDLFETCWGLFCSIQTRVETQHNTLRTIKARQWMTKQGRIQFAVCKSLGTVSDENMCNLLAKYGARFSRQLRTVLKVLYLKKWIPSLKFFPSLSISPKTQKTLARDSVLDMMKFVFINQLKPLCHDVVPSGFRFAGR
jgi:hypothetical protein